VVQILTSDEKRVVATVLTASIERKRVSQKTEFWFWKTASAK